MTTTTTSARVTPCVPYTGVSGTVNTGVVNNEEELAAVLAASQAHAAEMEERLRLAGTQWRSYYNAFFPHVIRYSFKGPSRYLEVVVEISFT